MASIKKIALMVIKRLTLFRQQLGLSFGKIHLVDKCLLVVMIILLTQSAHILFSSSIESPTVSPIDIVVRTSAASVFGYLLSGNFIQRSAKNNLSTTTVKAPTLLTEEHKNETPQNRIGFALGEPSSVLEVGDITNQPIEGEVEPAVISGLQILTASAIAIFCLLSLILVREFAGHDTVPTPATTAVLSQFRDFISGCIGFLIGCPTPRSGGK